MHPEQVERIRVQHQLIQRLRLVVSRENDNDKMQLRCEVAETEFSHLDPAIIEQTIRAVTQLSGEVSIEPLGSLPNDGIVIEDRR